jgi:hypothetical protein
MLRSRHLMQPLPHSVNVRYAQPDNPREFRIVETNVVNQKRIPGPCSVVRDNPHPGQGTVVVLGTPRGGTSVVAGICHHLGARMGLDIDRSNMEDVRFRSILRSENRVQLAREYLEQLHQLGPLVGAKDPSAIDHLAEVYPLIPSPILVVVSRDVYASAQREVVEGHEFFEILRTTIRRKYAILDFVESVNDPVILVTYERMMQQPLSAVRSLARFVVGDAPDRLINLTARLVQPHADMPHEVDFVASRARWEREQFLGGSGSVA